MMQNQNSKKIQKSFNISYDYKEISDVFIKAFGRLRSDGSFSFTKYNVALNIHFVHSGEGKLFCDKREFDVRGGDIFVLFPNQQTHYFDHFHTPWDYDWFTLVIPDDSPIFDNLRITRDSPVVKCPETSPMWLRERQISSQLENDNETSLLPICAAWELLNFLSESSPLTKLDTADQMKNLIDSFERPMTVKELANHFHVDRSTVYRLFKKKFDVSVKEYIDDVNFQEVLNLLEKSDYSISTIAECRGFGSPHYFSRVFRERFGVSPTEWKRKALGIIKRGTKRN